MCSPSVCHAVCVSAALVLTAKVMRCIQCSIVNYYYCHMTETEGTSQKQGRAGGIVSGTAVDVSQRHHGYYYYYYYFFFFFWYSAVHNSRSMTPITWQAAVDDEEQRPLLQDILEAAVDDRRQLTSKNSGPSCKTSSKQPSMGIMSWENSRGGFPLPSSLLLLLILLLLIYFDLRQSSG